MSSGVELTPSLVGLILFPDKRKPLWKSLRRPENPSLVGFIRFLDVRLLDYRLYNNQCNTFVIALI
jgi:hypothetical protein